MCVVREMRRSVSEESGRSGESERRVSGESKWRVCGCAPDRRALFHAPLPATAAVACDDACPCS